MLSQLLILALLTGPAQPPAPKDGPFYPLQVGNAWHYKVGDKKATMKVVAMEKIGDLMTSRIETIVDGNVSANENIAQTAGGLMRVAVDGEKYSKPIMFLKLPPMKGESWNVDSKIPGTALKGKFVAGDDEIEVAAGKFKCATSSGELQINGQPAQFGYWFAPNVGIVRLTMKVGGMELTWDLQKFEPAK